jgi:U-box domain
MSVPNEFLCPITLTIMKDPVIASDGYSYERTAIVQWLRMNPLSPLTRQPMDINFLQRNYALRAAIERHISQSRQPTFESYYIQPSAPPLYQVAPTAPPLENYQPIVRNPVVQSDTRRDIMCRRLLCLSIFVFPTMIVIVMIVQGLAEHN